LTKSRPDEVCFGEASYTGCAPGVTQARAMSSVTSRPLAGNAAVEAVSFSLKEVLPTPAAG
jgi:hypothetical protein